MGSVVFTVMDFTFLAIFFSTLAVSFQGRPPNRPSATTATTATASTTVAATTVGAVDYDDSMTLARDLIEADSCPDVVSNGNCEYNATLTSYFSTFDYNGMRVIVTSGVPDHEAEADMTKANPNRRCEKWAYMVVPKDVDKSEEPTDTSMGTTGLAVTGGHFYNVLSSSDGSLAAYYELSSLDSCFGHSQADGDYHYHANINCTEAGSATGANDPDECIIIGYMQDGVPLYGFCRDSEGAQYNSCYTTYSTTDEIEHVSGYYTMAADWSDYSYDSSLAGCNLDEGNGAYHPTTGDYSYFMTNNFPFLPAYVYGEFGLDQSSYCGLGI